MALGKMGGILAPQYFHLFSKGSKPIRIRIEIPFIFAAWEMCQTEREGGEERSFWHANKLGFFQNFQLGIQTQIRTFIALKLYQIEITI